MNIRIISLHVRRALSRWGLIGLIAVLLAGVGVWLEVSLRMLPQPSGSQALLLSPQNDHAPTPTIRRVSERVRNQDSVSQR